MDCFSLGLSIDVMAMGITLGEGGTGLGSFGKQVEKHVDPQRRISPFFHETSGLCWMSQGLPRMIAEVEFSKTRGVNGSSCKQPTLNVIGFIRCFTYPGFKAFPVTDLAVYGVGERVFGS